jgi:hypothetical protein
MDDLRVVALARSEAMLAEHSTHGGILRQDVGG